METIKIGKNEYTLQEFGRLVALKRNNRKPTCSQNELAEEVFKCLPQDKRPKNINATRVMIGRLENGIGTKFPSDELIGALVNTLNLEERPKDKHYREYRVEQIMDELKIIIDSVPPRTAESILTFACMIKNGAFNNTGEKQ